MKNYIKKFIVIFMVIVMILPVTFPAISKAVDSQATANDEKITLDIQLQRDKTNPNFIQITATDSAYTITDLKYVHQYIETDQIDYFEQDNSDVYTFDIIPAQTIQETFELDGYGSYTVYAKNSRGDRFIARLTVSDPSDMPQITLTKDEENPFILTIQVTSDNNTITKLKIAKKQNVNDTIDFSIQGTDIDFTESNDVTVRYTDISEEGLYVIYAEDNNGNKTTRQIYLGEQSTPITVEITEGNNPREVNLQITDAICNIISVKVARSSEISDFEDFETIEGLPITEGQNITMTYTAPEDDTYVFYIEDEAGYRIMTQKRITTEESSMQITVEQDENSPGNIKITATNNICNIVEMKVAVGNDIDIGYFKNNGEEITIQPGREVVGNYTVNENCTINVYIKDEQGYSYMYSKTLIGIDEPEPIPNEPPTITLTQNSQNPKQIDVTVTDKDSYIDEVKWAEGTHDIEYFATNGTQIGQGSLGSSIRTQFTINEIGTYTVYAKDEEGNEVVKEIYIRNIEEIPEEDITPPSIQTTNEIINENESVRISINVTDTESQITEVKIASGIQDVDYFENEGTTLKTIHSDKSAEAAVMITENGIYTIYAEDEQGNKTVKIIEITEIVIPDPEPDNTITSSVYEINTTTIDRISENTNVVEFKENIVTEMGYIIVNKEDIELQDTDIIATGDKLITDDDKEYILIVTGDLNGDGKLTLTDMSLLRKHYLEVESLQDEYLEAADIDYNQKISLNDISIMRKHILGIE